MKIRKKISTILNLASNKIFRNPTLIRNVFKPFIVSFINLITLGRGIKINIGGQGDYKFSPQFYFSNWENFGNKHNSGFLFVIKTTSK